MQKWLSLFIGIVVLAGNAWAQPVSSLWTSENTDEVGQLAEFAFEMAIGDTARLDLPDGTQHTVVFERSTVSANGDLLWVGYLVEAGSPYRVIVTRGSSATFGYIATPDGAWRIAPEYAGGPLRLMAETAPPLEPGSDEIRLGRQESRLPDLGPDAAQITDAIRVSENGTIDIGIVYTPGMVSFYGLGLTTRIQHLVNVLDQALIDSDTGLRARLVGATPVPGIWDEFTSTLESIDDLYAGASYGHPGSEPDVNNGQCSNGPGGCIVNGDLSSLLAWRNALGADIVVMLRRYWRVQQTYCGVAYVPGFGAEGEIDPAEDWVLGIAVSGDGPDGNGSGRSCGDLTFAHEVGHNLGSTHNVENTSNFGVFQFSYGHRIDCRLRTIMGYDSTRSGVSCPSTFGPNETWLPRFSNPFQSDCLGQACGVGPGLPHPGGSPGDDTTTHADNARSIREIGFNVRDYRPEGQIVRSALLPYSRTVRAGTPATAFVAIVNPAASGSIAENCGLILHGAAPGQFSFTPTDPATNAPSGPAGSRVNIPPGGVQTYVISLTRPGVESHADLRIDTDCSNRAPAPNTPGVNTFRFSTTNSSLPDVIALAATASGAGRIDLPPGGGAGAFSVATANVGGLGSVNVTPEVRAGGPDLSLLEVCRTDPATGSCLTARSASLAVLFRPDDTFTFTVFARSAGAIANDPAANRIFLNFQTPDGRTLGATSVAIRTQ